MLFGWGDLMAHRNTARWHDRTRLYHADGGRGGRTGAATIAPASRDAGVSNMIWEIHNLTGAFCVGEQCATLPGAMDHAAGYLNHRTCVKLYVRCSVVGIPWPYLREAARDVIKNAGDPVIIGTGWLQHYPLAYGYRVRSRLARWVGPATGITY
jgi:hypothetical protein